MYYFTGGRPGHKSPEKLAASSPNKQIEKKLQFPSLSIFRESIHLFSEEDKRRDKDQRKIVSEDEKQRAGGRKKKDKKRKRRSGTPETSIVPYSETNSRDGTENTGEQTLSDDLEGWDTVSIDSVNL